MDTVVADMVLPGAIKSMDASDVWVAMCTNHPLYPEYKKHHMDFFVITWHDLLQGRPCTKVFSNPRMQSVVFLHAASSEVAICIPPAVVVFDVAMCCEVSTVSNALPKCDLVACTQHGEVLAVSNGVSDEDSDCDDNCIVFFQRISTTEWHKTRVMPWHVQMPRFELEWLRFSSCGSWLVGRRKYTSLITVWLMDALNSHVVIRLEKPFSHAAAIADLPVEDVLGVFNWSRRDIHSPHGGVVVLSRVAYPLARKMGFEGFFIPFPKGIEAEAEALTEVGTVTLLQDRPHLKEVYGDEDNKCVFRLQALWSRQDLRKFNMSAMQLAWMHACSRAGMRL